MLMRQLEGSTGEKGVEGYVGRKRSMVDWGGMECLNFSCVDACMIVSWMTV